MVDDFTSAVASAFPGGGNSPTRKTKMRKKIKEIWRKIKETTGKWGKIEMFLFLPIWEREAGYGPGLNQGKLCVR